MNTMSRSRKGGLFGIHLFKTEKDNHKNCEKNIKRQEKLRRIVQNAVWLRTIFTVTEHFVRKGQ